MSAPAHRRRPARASAREFVEVVVAALLLFAGLVQVEQHVFDGVMRGAVEDAGVRLGTWLVEVQSDYDAERLRLETNKADAERLRLDAGCEAVEGDR